MMPKLTLLIDQDLRSLGRADTKASAHRSGYHHSWYDIEDAKYHILTQFPSDKKISSELLPHAYDEADQLLQLLGIPMHKSLATGPLSDAHVGFMDAASKFVEDICANRGGSDSHDENLADPSESTIIEDLEASFSLAEESPDLEDYMDLAIPNKT